MAITGASGTAIPDPEVRATALKKLKAGIAETAAVGADTMLLVPAHGKDGSDAEVYERAMAAINDALPDAEKHGVSILIENVWNDFLVRPRRRQRSIRGPVGEIHRCL